jgi:tubulin polyglutamylase TTLL6/13
MNPMRAYIYKEGLARFATEEYQPPIGSNLNNLCMHLTNYAINKDSDGFIFNDDPNKDNVGHKRSLTAILKHFDDHKQKESDKSGSDIWNDIKDVIVKTLITGQPQIAHLYRTSKADDYENSLSF